MTLDSPLAARDCIDEATRATLASNRNDVSRRRPESIRILGAAWFAMLVSAIGASAGADPPPLGSFLIVDADGGTPTAGEFPGAIFRFDPQSRTCQPFCTDARLVDPEDLILGLDGSIYVVDFGGHHGEISSVQGHIHRIDAHTGELLRTYSPLGLRGPTTVFPLTERLLLIGDRAANREPGGHAAMFLLDLDTGFLQLTLNDERYRVPSAIVRDRDGSLLLLDADAKSDPESTNEGVIFRIDPFRGESAVLASLEGTVSPLGMLLLEDGDFLIFDANADPKRMGAPIGAIFRYARESRKTELLHQIPRFRDPVRGVIGPDRRVWFVDANADPEKRGGDAPGRGQNLTGPGAIFAISLADGALETIASPIQFVNPTGILWQP